MATRTATKSETPPEDKQAEETPEEKTEETVPETPAAEEGLWSKITDYIDDKVEAIVAKKPAAGKRPSYRDEEDQMAETVAEKVKELIGKEKAQAEKHPEPGEEKAKPEPVPDKPRGTWRDRMWT